MTDTASTSSWPTGISAITLFTGDLDATKQFYGEVFGLPVVFENDNSAVFEFGNTVIKLLKITAAPALIALARVAPADAGSRLQHEQPSGLKTASRSGAAAGRQRCCR
ncbi:VOC family protein [Streptomyces flaveolus]|uniref:VOC family protein n=1 Tax=Streptomyces flaveolus TaxID=67297 RepID=UPI00341200CA